MRISKLRDFGFLLRRCSLCRDKENKKNFVGFGSRANISVGFLHLGRPVVESSILCLKSRMLLPGLHRHLHVLNVPVGSSGHFSVTEAKKFLNGKGLAPVAGNTCLRVECPGCRANPKPAVSHSDQLLYINLKTGHCLCPSCGLHGHWDNLKLFLEEKTGKADLASHLDPVVPPKNRDSVQDQLSTSAVISSENVEGLLSREFVRLKAETLEKAKCRVSFDRQSLLVPVTDSRGETVTFRTLSLADGSEKCLPETFVPLILHQKAAKDETVVTWDVKDALYCFQELKANVVCLPAGLSHLPQETLPYLEPFSKLTLWFGGGVHEWEAARVLAKKLNEKRCHFVRPSATTPGPSVAVLEDMSLPQIFKTRLPMFHDSVTTFSSLKDEVYAEILQVNEVAGIKWKRFQKLNELMKGFRRGELTVFTGPTGAGKTTFISEYSLDLCMQKVNTLWGSFEIRNVRLAKMMLTQFAGISLEANPEKFNEFADEFEKLPLFFLTFHGQQDLKSVMEAVNYATYVHDIGHVIVDNLQFMMGTGIASSDRMDMLFLQDRIIGAFRQFATNNNVHVTLVIHPRKEDVSEELTTASVFGSAKATQEADNVLILQDRKILDPGGKKKYLQIAKNRFSGDLGIVPLSFDRECLSFAKKKPTKLSTAWESAEEINKGKQTNERRKKPKIFERLKEQDQDADIS